jgi:cysteine desulfurase
VDKARRQVAALIGADPKEIVFTSGATESEQPGHQGRGVRCTPTSPPAREARAHHHGDASSTRPCSTRASASQKEGFDVTYLEPGPDGVITAEMVEEAMREDTILVTIMWANNEIGTINEVPEIGELCHERGVIFHTDATQWVGKMPDRREPTTSTC